MMSIQDISNKFKSFLGNDSLFTTVLILLVSTASFGLGRQSVEPAVAMPAQITQTATVLQTTTLKPEISASPSSTTIEYVASKNSDKYHLPWCSGAKRISDANKIYFSSKEEATKAGYTPASNCKGI